MPWFFIACACSALSRIANSPPWTLGCRVLTLPSIISGNPVNSETSLTFSPAAAIALAVPPVETSSTPRLASARANSTSPDLSETDSKARVTRRGWSVMTWSLMMGSPGSMVSSAIKPVRAPGNSWSQILQRQFRFAARVASRRRGRRRSRRACETPADRGSVAQILANHDLGGAARSVVAGQENAVFEIDPVVQRLEGPDVAVRQYQHDTSRVAEAACLHGGVQVKPQRVVGLIALDPATWSGRQGVLAVEPDAVMREHQHTAMHHAELIEIAVMRCREQLAIGDLFAIALHIGGAADDRSALQQPLQRRKLDELAGRDIMKSQRRMRRCAAGKAAPVVAAG